MGDLNEQLSIEESVLEYPTSYSLEETETNSTIQLYKNSLLQIKNQNTLLLASNENVLSACSLSVKNRLSEANINAEEWIALLTSLLDETMLVLEEHVEKMVSEDTKGVTGE